MLKDTFIIAMNLIFYESKKICKHLYITKVVHMQNDLCLDIVNTLTRYASVFIPYKNVVETHFIYKYLFY